MVADALPDSIARLAAEFACSRAERQRRRGLDPRDFDALRDAGFHRLALPAEHSGLWRDVRRSARPLCRSLRVLARADASVALVASMHPAVLSYWLMAPAEARSDAWDAQRQAVLDTAWSGAWWGTITSEPGSGGDIQRTQATARQCGSGLEYRLSGRKHFGSGSGVTSYMVTTALPEGESTPDWFFLDVRGAPWDGSRGLTLVAEWDGHGMAATQSHAMTFNDFPATRFAWPGKLLEVSRRTGPFIACLFTSVIMGVVDAALTAAAEKLASRELSPFEETEWTRARREGWLAAQALEGMLRAVEEQDDPRLEALQGKTAVAELAESTLSRICRTIGGGTYSRASPFGHWLEDVRALGFLRPPWGLAFDMMADLL